MNNLASAFLLRFNPFSTLVPGFWYLINSECHANEENYSIKLLFDNNIKYLLYYAQVNGDETVKAFSRIRNLERRKTVV
jgi:hypothetical protein